MARVLSIAVLAFSHRSLVVLAYNRHCEAECYVSNSNWLNCQAKLWVKADSCGPGARRVTEGSQCKGAWWGKCVVSERSRAECRCETHCRAHRVVGYWSPKATLVGSGKVMLETGTRHTSDETKTEEWSDSAALSAAARVELPAPGGAATSLSRELSGQLSRAHKTYFEASRRGVFEISVPRQMQGRYLWQWQYEVHDTCLYNTASYTQELAITEGNFSRPCCAPGYCTDLASGSCSECYSEATLLPGAGSRCHVAGRPGTGPTSGSPSVDTSPLPDGARATTSTKTSTTYV